MSQELHQQGRELISFRIGEQEFSVDIEAVVEIRGWTPATPMPQAPAYLRGVINLRGVIMPVLDLSARLGLGMAEPTDRHVIIVVDVRGRKVGLLVDAVCETLTIRPEEVQMAPQMGEGAAPRFIVGFIPMPDRMITLVDLETVLPDGGASQAA